MMQDRQSRMAEADRMWFGSNDDDLADHEKQQLAEAKATIERVRRIQTLRGEVRRTEEEHKRALDALADASLELATA